MSLYKKDKNASKDIDPAVASGIEEIKLKQAEKGKKVWDQQTK